MQSTPHVVCSRNDEFRWWQNDLERLHFRIRLDSPSLPYVPERVLFPARQRCLRLDSSSLPHAPGPCPVPGPCNVSRLVRAQGPSLIPSDAGAAARPHAPETRKRLLSQAAGSRDAETTILSGRRLQRRGNDYSLRPHAPETRKRLLSQAARSRD